MELEIRIDSVGQRGGWCISSSTDQEYLTTSYYARLSSVMAKSDLPFGSEFSPNQIGLQRVLGLAAKHGGNWPVFEDAVRKRYFD